MNQHELKILRKIFLKLSQGEKITDIEIIDLGVLLLYQQLKNPNQQLKNPNNEKK